MGHAPGKPSRTFFPSTFVGRGEGGIRAKRDAYSAKQNVKKAFNVQRIESSSNRDKYKTFRLYFFRITLQLVRTYSYCIHQLNERPIAFFIQELAFDPNKSMRNRIYIAHCVPHTCSGEDVTKHTEGVFQDISQEKVTTSVGTVKCQTKTPLLWTWGDYTFLCVPIL